MQCTDSSSSRIQRRRRKARREKEKDPPTKIRCLQSARENMMNLPNDCLLWLSTASSRQTNGPERVCKKERERERESIMRLVREEVESCGRDLEGSRGGERQ